MERGLVADARRIAVFRATALGDLIFALPALQAIHETYPRAEITYLGRAWHAAFLPGRLAGVNRVVAVPPARGEAIRQGRVIDEAVEEPFLRQMRAERFDIAFQMQGGGGFSNPFVNAMGARVTVGCRAPQAEALDRWIPYVYYQNETARLLEVAALAGAKAASLSPVMPVLAADRAAAADFLAGVKGPFAVLHPGSTDPRRCWSPEKFAQVGDALHDEHGLTILITGVDTEPGRAAAVKAAMRAPALNLCGQLGLEALTGVLARAELVVANDTGPLHLGLAVGARAVGLFWSEYIVNSLPLERGSFAPLISWERRCPRCGASLDKREADDPSVPGCAHEVSFIESIAPRHVLDAAAALLVAR